MSGGMPEVPAGNGKHPVAMVVVAANMMAESKAFYTKVFGWHIHAMSSELGAVMLPAGPAVTLRAGVEEGFQGTVPFIQVANIDSTMAQVIAAGGSLEKAAWSIPMVGSLARFKDPSGTIYGLLQAMTPGPMPRMGMPFGAGFSQPAGVVCSLEMHSSDGPTAASFFGDVFGWGTAPTMPRFVGFDPGAGVAGVFQSHTPALRAVAYLYVADVGATLVAIDAAGGKRMGEPMAMPGMATFGYFSDPSGTTVGLIGP